MKPIFSVITATYNRGYVLWKTIESLQRQTYPYWELIIVDDGSTDSTEQVVAEFQKDPRIEYFRIKHSNGSCARNFGLKKAKGDIITYLDSDDYLYENYLSITLEYFQKYPKAIFAICNYNRRLELYENHKLIAFDRMSSAQKLEVTLQDFYHWDVKTCGTSIFHKSKTIKDKIFWDPKFVMLDDLDFILQMGRKYPNGFLHIPYVLFEYLQKFGGDGIVSSTSYYDQGRAFEQIYDKHKNDPLMRGQQWYPEKVLQYKNLDKEARMGKIPSPQYKYFPKYFKLKNERKLH